MPSRSQIVLTDGTTPVTLTPRGGELGRTQYAESGAVIAAAGTVLDYQYRDTAAGVNRQAVRLKRPIHSTDGNGKVIIDGQNICDISVAISPSSTPAERALFVAYCKSVFDALATELNTGEGQW